MEANTFTTTAGIGNLATTPLSFNYRGSVPTITITPNTVARSNAEQQVFTVTASEPLHRGADAGSLKALAPSYSCFAISQTVPAGYGTHWAYLPELTLQEVAPNDGTTYTLTMTRNLRLPSGWQQEISLSLNADKVTLTT